MALTVDEINVVLGADISDFENGMNASVRSLQNVSKKMMSVGKTMSAAITLPLLGIGAAAIKASEDIDKAMDNIRAGTGATGIALGNLGDDFKAVFATVPDDAQKVSTAIADLNTRLGLTGKPLQEFATQMLNLARITGTEVGPLVASAARVFGDWAVSTEKQSDTLNYLFKTSQSTGIGVDALARKLVQFGAPLRSMGFSLEDSAALMGKWEKEGVNSERILGSLSIAMGNFARDNIPMREGLDKTIKRITELGPGAKATALAMDVFGARAGPDMAAAILEGRFAIEELLNILNKSPETINIVAKDVASLSEAMGIMKNKVTLALDPLGKELVQAFLDLQPAMENMISTIGNVLEKFNSLSPVWKKVVLGIVGLLIAIGPLLIVFGAIANSIKILLPIIAKLRIAFLDLSASSVILGLKIAFLIGLGVLLYKNFDIVRDIAQKVADKLQGSLIPAIVATTGVVAGLLAVFLGFGAKMSVIIGMVAAFAALAFIVITNWSSVAKIFSAVATLIAAGFKSVYYSVKRSMLGLVQVVYRLFNKMLDIIEPAMDRIARMGRLAGKLGKIMGWLGGKMGRLGGRIGKIADEFYAARRSIDAYGKTLSSSLRGVDATIGNVAGSISGARKLINRNWNALTSNVVKQVKNIVSRIKSGFSSAVPPIEDYSKYLSKAGKSTNKYANEAYNAADATDKMKDSMTDAITAIDFLDHQISMLNKQLELYKLTNRLAEDSTQYLNKSVEILGAEQKIAALKVKELIKQLNALRSVGKTSTKEFLDIESALLDAQIQYEKFGQSIDDASGKMRSSNADWVKVTNNVSKLAKEMTKTTKAGESTIFGTKAATISPGLMLEKSSPVSYPNVTSSSRSSSNENPQGMTSPQININQMIVRKESDINAIATQLFKLQQNQLRARGVTP